MLVLGLLLVQVGLMIHGGGPKHVFAFRMFPEASTWEAEVVRVTHEGRRIPVDQPWADGAYQWAAMVTDGSLERPAGQRHADNGLDSVLDDLQRALDWIAANTPLDSETRYYEAVVTAYRNTRGPEVTVLRSPDRPQPEPR